MKNKGKVIALGIIWVSVAGLGWHAYRNVLPKYGYFTRPRNRQANNERWQAIQKEQEEFFKETISKIAIVADEPEAGEAWENSGTHTNDKGIYYYGLRTSALGPYGEFSGTPRWQLTGAPGIADKRYNFRIKVPKGQRKEAAAALLKELELDVRQRPQMMKGYRLAEGPPPVVPSPSPQQRQQGTSRWPAGKLKDVRSLLENNGRAPVQIDDAVKERAVLSADKMLTVNWQLTGPDFVNGIAAQYGVAVNPYDAESTQTLLFNPDNVKPAQLARWSMGEEL